MHFSSILLLATPLIAFTIPEGQADGVYQVSYVDGNEVHQLLPTSGNNESNPPTTLSAKFRTKRQASFECGGDSLDHGQTDHANSALDRQCGSGLVVGSRDIYSISGCTVAYYCNFSDFGVCTAQQRGLASKGITNWCGSYRSGWTTGTSQSYGYEDFCKWPGSHFCGRGP